MSNVVVTELIVDARGAEVGSAAYERAMRVAQAAIDKQIDREQKLQLAIDKTSAAMTGGATSVGRVASQWQNLAARADPAIRASQMIADAQLKADAAIRRGITTEQEATRVLAAYAAQINGTTNATRELQRQQDALARQDAGNIAKVDAYLARQRQEATALTRDFDPLIAAQERYNASVDQANRLARQSLISEETRRAAIAASRRALETAGAPSGQFSSSIQRGLDYASVVRHSGGSARASASVFEEDARAMDAMTTAAARLRAEIDPLSAAQAKLSAELAEFQAMATRGVITTEELGQATALANARHMAASAALGEVTEAARLTSQQMLNLSRQGNDVITMWLMGAPAMQIFASQAGQIYGALEEGPRGLRGSLEAIRNSVSNFVVGLGPAGIALGALGVAAAGFALVTRRDVKPLEDVIKSQADAVRQLRDAYGLAGDAAESYARRAPNAVRRDAESATDANMERAQNEIRERIVSQYAGSFNRLNEMRFEGAKELRAAFDELFQSVASGVPRFNEFREQLALIPEDDLPYFIREAIRANREWAATFVPLQQEIEGTQDALSGIALAAQNYRKAMSDLVALTPDLRTNAERINAAFNAARSGPADGDEMVAMFQRQKAMAADTAGALEVYTRARADLANVGLGDEARAIAEINAQYDALEDQYLGNADALAVLVDAREAAIEAVNAQSAFDAGEKAKKDAEEYTKALSDQARGIDEQIDALRRQATMFGQSEGAVAAAEFRTRALADAYALARENNEIVTPGQIADIEAAAAEIGVLTNHVRALREEEKRRKLVADTLKTLQFEGSIIGLPDVEQQVARQLHQLGITADDVSGRQIANQIRYNDHLQKTQDQLKDMGSFVDDLGDIFADIFSSATRDGESFFGSVTRALAGLGSQLAAAGAKNLFGQLFGLPQDGSARSAAGIGNIAGALGSAATAATPAPTFSAPLGHVERSVLPAIDRTTTRFAANSNDLAENIRISAQTLGVAARDIATVISFETGGSFDPWQKGPTTKWGQHRGLIQWGEPQRERYGVTQMSTVAEQMRAVTEYLRDAGVRQGHTLLDIYSAVNAGRVGRYNASDTAAGGTWGTVRDKVEHQMAGHMLKADSLLGGTRQEFRQSVAQGVAQGVDHWAGLRTVTPGASAPMGGGFVYQNAQGQTVNSMGLTRGQQIMGGVGAGLGIFSQGVQSGSVGMGALSGGLGGFQAAGALGIAGPVGFVAGAALGALGGLFGNRQKREQEHQQKAQQWAQMGPQWEEYQRMLREDVGPSSGLRAAYGAIDAQMGQFVGVGSAAWKRGSNNSSELFDQVSQSRVDYQRRTNEAFQRRYWGTLGSLETGRGMNGPFVDAQDAIAEAGKALVTFADDATLVFGEGSAEAERARAASVTQLRAMLTGGQELSEVGASVERMQGAATALRHELVLLGVSAEEAGAMVRDDLAAAMGELAGGITRDLQDAIDELDGKGYLADFRALIEGIEQQRKDIVSYGLNVDTSLLDTFFTKRAQNLVDQAELTGDAFAELTRLFPQLTGAVNEFSAAAEDAAQTAEELARATLDTARSDLDRAWQAHQDAANERIRALRTEATELERTVSRLTDFTAQLKEFRESLLLDANLSTLAPDARLAEAERQFRDIAARAAGGDEDAQRQLTGASERWLTESRDFWGISERYYANFDEVRRVIEQQERAAQGQLTEAQRQLEAVERQITLEEEGLKLAQKQYETLIGIHHGVMSLGTAMAAFATAMAAARAAGVDVGAGGGTTVPTDASFGRGVDYLNKNPDVAAGIAAGQTFGLPAGSSLEAIARAHWERHGQFEDPTKRKGYSTGGLITGPGTATSDSINIRASNGEFMVRQSSVDRIGVGNLDWMNRTGTLPSLAPVRQPSITLETGLTTAIEKLAMQNAELKRELAHLTAVVQATHKEAQTVRTQQAKAAGKSAAAAERDAA